MLFEILSCLNDINVVGLEIFLQIKDRKGENIFYYWSFTPETGNTFILKKNMKSI